MNYLVEHLDREGNWSPASIPNFFEQTYAKFLVLQEQQPTKRYRIKSINRHF